MSSYSIESASPSISDPSSAAGGPNLLVTGSIATIICRPIARENGTDLSPLRFSLVGIATVPVQLALAYLGFVIVRAV